jgi:hypothetical protein
VAVAVAAPLALLAADIAETVLIQVVGQLVAEVTSSVLAPELAQLQQAAWKLNPSQVLTPDQAAIAQVKGHLDQAQAQAEAQLSGIDAERFATLTQAAGNPPSAEFLLQLARRGIIPIADERGPESVSAEQGIRESFLHNKWITVLEEGQWQLPSLGSVIEARLRSYITPEEFNIWTHRLGLKDDASGLEFLAAGVPISPQEAYAAFHRGLIPLKGTGAGAVSLEQAFKESRIIDKYLDVWTALQAYIPPPRTVTALLREGSISQAEALTLFKYAGLSDELAAAYVRSASKQKTQATKELAKSDVLRLYAAKEITTEQATAMLGDLGYEPEEIGFELGYQDFKLVESQVANALTRLRSLYIGHKIDKPTTTNAIDSLGLDPKARDQLLAIWSQEAQANPVLLTAVEIANAAHLGLIAGADALSELQGRGYDARDAYILLVLHHVDLSGVSVPPGIALQ